LSAEDGEALIARVHLSSLPRADAEQVEWVIRMYFSVVFALQEAKRSVKRLRTWLFGQRPTPSLAPEASSAASPGDADGAGATGHHAPPGASPRPEGGTPQGGQRPGTGRLGADAYAGATRVECRHEELAAGPRGPVCGQGTL
jgi:hypothetical protein